MRRVTLGLMATCMVLGAATAGTLQDAESAFARGDRAAALRLIGPLAAQGRAEALPLLDRMFYTCDAALTGYTEAAVWFRKAAGKGHRLAQFNLANFYYFGRGVAKDRAEAAKWYRKAADQGLPAAQLNLGYMYAKGQGVPQDYVQGYKWLDLAALPRTGKQTPEKAAKLRDEVAAKMTSAQIGEAQNLARQWKLK